MVHKYRRRRLTLLIVNYELKTPLMLLRLLIITGLLSNFSLAQDIQYVAAENGLIIREQPSQGALKLEVLDYGTALEIVEYTDLQLDLVDGGKKLSGKWVKVRSTDAYDLFEEGYVFNGYLTEDVLDRRFKVIYDKFAVSIKDLPRKTTSRTTFNSDFNDILFYTLEPNETLENKVVIIKHHQDFRSIKVFQKHENSIAISDDKSHADIINWKHYYSSWKPLKTIKNHLQFKTSNISKKEATKFIDVNLDSLKAVVKDACGTAWSDSIKNVKSLDDSPINIVVSKMYLRILMTDMNGEETEKILIFELSIDHEQNDKLYAKI